ncbi:MAG: hypothetical protein JWO21_415 [Solirubrobacterales bacterium]|nr:hypothetical protein [Solirubrobacterales bacterium]
MGERSLERDWTLDNPCMAESVIEKAHAIVEDYCGEGPIALPEVKESFERDLSLEEVAAVDLAVEVLSALCGDERFRVQRGRALEIDLLAVGRADQRRLIEERRSYSYGEGGEVRTWFSLDCLPAR